MDEPEVAAADRRRPGRVDYRNANLIAMLRWASRPCNDQADAAPEPQDNPDQERKLPVATAFAFIVFASLLLWVLIGIGLRLMLE